ncbi:MAG: ABC transporter ATP-binding protein [candidate division Zixibacteria bacterium HGW-Zixibacteria-1]|nr:MAG: ABC transporter ATP-binding protein [candidate division Zixibacteria bacterium HGW-Zixibacteria-1]
MNSTTAAIRVENLTKIYKSALGANEVQALTNVSLEVQRGEIFGLLGPNGAGKTTLVKILLGSLGTTAGAAFINGHSIDDPEARGKIGFLPENHRFPSYQTGLQMLLCFGGMAGLSRDEIKTKAAPLLELVDMTKWRDTGIKKYSKGMMQRLGLAQALINDPDIIFLDEPTDGVDPIGRHQIRNILIDLKKQGKTIFLNSHLLAEVESICDRVAILDKGKMIKAGPVHSLITMKPTYHVETAELNEEIEVEIKIAFPDARIEGNFITVIFDDKYQINGLIDLLRQNYIDILAVTPEKISLEESFMQLIKGGGGNA